MRRTARVGREMSDSVRGVSPEYAPCQRRAVQISGKTGLS